MCAHVCVCMFVCVYVHIHVCVYECMFVCVCAHAHMCVCCVHEGMHGCACMCVRVHVSVSERGFYRLKMEKTAVPAVTYRKDFVFHYSVTFNFRRVILCDCNGLVT